MFYHRVCNKITLVQADPHQLAYFRIFFYFLVKYRHGFDLEILLFSLFLNHGELSCFLLMIASFYIIHPFFINIDYNN